MCDSVLTAKTGECGAYHFESLVIILPRIYDSSTNSFRHENATMKTQLYERTHVYIVLNGHNCHNPVIYF